MGDEYRMMYYIYSRADGFRRVFPHVKNANFDDEWFYITDEKNIQWEFKKEFHTIAFEYERGDWAFIAETADRILVDRTIEKLHKKNPDVQYVVPVIKEYDGECWYTRIYESGTSDYYILIF